MTSAIELADLGIGGADGGHGRDLLAVVDRPGVLLELARRSRSTPLSRPRLTIIGLAPAVTFLRPSVDERLAEHDGGGGAVAGDVVGLGRDLLEELRAHVLERLFELDLAGDGHAVIGDGRGAELLVQHDVAALGAERHLDGVGELVDAPLEGATSGLVKDQLLCHGLPRFVLDLPAPAAEGRP